ncbi:MAG: organic solvent tolerance protein OstA [Hyphomicrobiales bacterium]|nr:organic solvent tolerance protein OstA [Hyphomicrobiales bacterium]
MKRARQALVLVALAGCAPVAAHAAGGMLPGARSGEPYTVDADKLDYFENQKKLVYSGSVIATQGASKVRGATMTVYLDKDGDANSQQNVRRVEMAGPVTVTQNGKIGTGDSGLYDRDEQKYYLIGRVTLSEGQNVTRGDRLIYDLRTNQARVVGRVQSVFTPKSR